MDSAGRLNPRPSAIGVTLWLLVALGCSSTVDEVAEFPTNEGEAGGGVCPWGPLLGGHDVPPHHQPVPSRAQ